MHLLSTKNMTRESIFRIFKRASYFQKDHKRLPVTEYQKILANLFYEPSTRTSSSFFSAMTRLGHTVLSINEVKYSSVTKGETLEDTIRTISKYVDVIVLRHPDEGSAAIAAKVSDVPIINAGDGTGEHPTQTLLDFYTIWKKYYSQGIDIDKLTVTLMGDLKHGRTIHSLLHILKLYDIKIYLVSPSHMEIPYDIFNEVDKTGKDEGNRIIESSILTEDICRETDILYVTRVQKERGAVGSYALTHENVDLFKDNMMVMHPLPRNEEIPKWFDNDRRAFYFKQIENGLYIRMAILEGILNDEI